MAVRGLNLAETRKFVSKADPCRGPMGEPLDGATVFDVGTLPADVRAWIADQGNIVTQVTEVSGNTQGLKLNTNLSSRNLRCCVFGLKGWVNFSDDRGAEIPFNTVQKLVSGKMYQGMTDDAINSLGAALIDEIGQEIWDANIVTQAEAKN